MIFIPYIGSIVGFPVTMLATWIRQPIPFCMPRCSLSESTLPKSILLTPVPRRAVYLPPALTIVIQVLLGLLAGFIGLALATPISAASLVLVKMLYLGEQPEHHS
jgi:predicted PurR-regulated permease PerM